MLYPVFAGRNPEGELYTLYQDSRLEEELTKPQSYFDIPREVRTLPDYYLLLPNGERWALNPDTTELTQWMDTDLEFTHVRIKSEVWTGELKGSKVDLVEARILDLSQ